MHSISNNAPILPKPVPVFAAAALAGMTPAQLIALMIEHEDRVPRNVYIVLTHDLDFGAILAATRAHTPSVIQIRTQDVLSGRFQELLPVSLRQFKSELEAGALIVVDEMRARARILPLAR